MVNGLFFYRKFTQSTYYKSAFTSSHAHKYTGGRDFPQGDTCSVGTHSHTRDAASRAMFATRATAGPCFLPAPFVITNYWFWKTVNLVIIWFWDFFFIWGFVKNVSPLKTKQWPQSDNKNEGSCWFWSKWWLTKGSPVWVALFTFHLC